MHNVIVRSISGVVFIILMIACLLFNKFLFAGLVMFIMAGMLSEFYNITMGKTYTFSKVLAILAGITLFALMFAWSCYHIPIRMIGLAIVPLFIIMINSLYVKDKERAFSTLLFHLPFRILSPSTRQVISAAISCSVSSS